MKANKGLTMKERMDVFLPAGGRMWTTKQSMFSQQSASGTIKRCVCVFCIHV